MSTDKALDIPCGRQLFHQRYFPPYANDPLSHASCCVIHDLLYCATSPPSTLMACPVTNEVASEQSHITAFVIFSGCSSLFRGVLAIALWSNCGLTWIQDATIGVWITPGHIAFIRIPTFAYCNAADFVKPTTPCLLASYRGKAAEPTNPAAEAVFTIAPPPCCTI